MTIPQREGGGSPDKKRRAVCPSGIYTNNELLSSLDNLREGERKGAEKQITYLVDSGTNGS